MNVKHTEKLFQDFSKALILLIDSEYEFDSSEDSDFENPQSQPINDSKERNLL